MSLSSIGHISQNSGKVLENWAMRKSVLTLGSLYLLCSLPTLIQRKAYIISIQKSMIPVLYR